MCTKENICHCKHIIDLTKHEYRRCVLNTHPCEKCTLYYKNEKAIILLTKELKTIKKQNKQSI
jgi:hypothetical protein